MAAVVAADSASRRRRRYHDEAIATSRPRYRPHQARRGDCKELAMAAMVAPGCALQRLRGHQQAVTGTQRLQSEQHRRSGASTNCPRCCRLQHRRVNACHRLRRPPPTSRGSTAAPTTRCRRSDKAAPATRGRLSEAAPSTRCRPVFRIAAAIASMKMRGQRRAVCCGSRLPRLRQRWPGHGGCGCSWLVFSSVLAAPLPHPDGRL